MEHIENWARENEEKLLKEEVRGMKPQQRGKHLIKVADKYLANMGYDIPLIMPD